MALTPYIGLHYLLDCDYLFQYEEGISIFYYLFLYRKSHAISLCNFHLGIPVDILGHFSKIVEQYNKFKVG